MTAVSESDTGKRSPGITPTEPARIPWEKLTGTEHGSITQGVLRADYTFRFMSSEDAKEAGRRHRESVAQLLAGLSVGDPVMPRSKTDAVAMAAADFVAHLHDDLPPGPVSELGSDNSSDLVELPEAEYLRRAALGKAFIDSYVAAQSS